MKPADLAALLQDVYRDRLAQYQRHITVAAHVTSYDANNTYQYVINREEVHLQWLGEALEQLDAAVPDAPAGSIDLGRQKDAWRALAAEDAATGRAFVERWEPRLDTITNARQRTMLKVLMGEVREQVRFFEQAAAGQDDLLGRKGEGAGKRGVVAGSRWLGD